MQPELAFGNRILRRFGGEYCLRVVFRDENFFKLSSFEVSQTEEISERLGDYLLSGIHLPPRHYQFLACSNSQLRDHGCWLYATDDEGNSASDIRHWMGDFSGINSVAKYIARMGQCFSKSEETIDISDEGVIVRNNKDLKKSDGYREYCFSDGIGKVSESLADRVSELIIEPNDEHDKARDLIYLI